jgi:hypothetical protein
MRLHFLAVDCRADILLAHTENALDAVRGTSNRMTLGSSGLALALGVLAFARLHEAHAQSGRRELVGKVRDSIGAPIEGALVEIPGAASRTNFHGAFQLWTGDADTITLSVRRIGYVPLKTVLIARGRAWDTVVVELNASMQSLTAVAVTEPATRRGLGLRGFEERRAIGLGMFVTREQIASRNSSRPSDVVRGMRGVNLVRLRSGGYGIRFTPYTAARPTCPPDIYIDGQLARGTEIDDLSSDDIEAMELYQSWSTVPLQFSQGSVVPCGTIVIWTRVPGR